MMLWCFCFRDMPPRRKHKEVGGPKGEKEEQDLETEREMYQLQVARAREIAKVEEAARKTNSREEDSSRGRQTSRVQRSMLKPPSSTIQSGEYEALMRSPRVQVSQSSQRKGMDKPRSSQAKEKERDLLRKRLAELESEEEEETDAAERGARGKRILPSRPLKKRKEWPGERTEYSWEMSLKREMKQAAARVLAAEDGSFFGGSRDRGRDARDYGESDKEEVSSDNSDDDTSEEERKERARKKNKKKEARKVKRDIFKPRRYESFDDYESLRFDKEAMEVKDAEYAMNLQHEEYRGWSAGTPGEETRRAWYQEEEEEEISLDWGGERDQSNRAGLERDTSQEDQEGEESSQEEEGEAERSWQNGSEQGSREAMKEEKENESLEREIIEADRLLKEDELAKENGKEKPVVVRETSNKRRGQMKEVAGEGPKGREGAPKRDQPVRTERVGKEIPFAAGPPANMGRIPRHTQQRTRSSKEEKRGGEIPELKEKSGSGRPKIIAPSLKEIKREPVSPPEVKKRGSMTVTDEIDLTMDSSAAGQKEDQKRGAGRLSALVNKLKAKVGERADKTSTRGSPGNAELEDQQKVEVKRDEKKTRQERPDDFPPQEVIDGMEPFSEGENEADVLKKILKESKEMGKSEGGKSETSCTKVKRPGLSGTGRGSRKKESPTTRGRGRDPRGRGTLVAPGGRGRKPAGSQEARLDKDER